MHLKNFALLKTKENNIQLSPAFDLVNTKVAMPADTEEMALTINAKKRKLKKTDFLIMAKTLGISERSTQNSFEKFARLMPGIKQWIDDSFLPPKAKRLYNDVMHSHSERMELL